MEKTDSGSGAYDQRDELNALWEKLEAHAPELNELTEVEAMEIALEAVAWVRSELRRERMCEP